MASPVLLTNGLMGQEVEEELEMGVGLHIVGLGVEKERDIPVFSQTHKVIVTTI